MSMQAELESQGYRCFAWSDRPGTVYPPHTHPHDEVLCILRGCMEMEVAGRRHLLEPGDRLELPRNTVHSARVLGDEPVEYLIAQR
jgi:quercetin dioxygenase-like cupin family protein